MGREPENGEPTIDPATQATLRWSARAATDLARIHRFVARDNPAAAAVLIGRIYDAAQELARFPMRGRPGRVAGTRELVIAQTPYSIAYRRRGTVVQLLTVRHGARVWPGKL